MIARIATKAGCLVILLLFAVMVKGQVAANFTAAPTSGCAPLVVSFTDHSTGNPTQWRWDLGNGTISFLQNPSVTYFNPGVYNVKLVVRNASGIDSIVRSQYIQIFAKPTVQFSSSNTTGCYPLTVNFNDQSLPGSGNIVSWQWDFGDGFTSTEQNPHHIYTASGNYNVTLQVRNSNGCVNTITRAAYIVINNGVNANFSTTVPNTCTVPVDINFTNTTVGTGTINYQWIFGDGNTSTDANPIHTYTTQGSYTVTLIAVNSMGCSDTLVKPNTISLGTVHAYFNHPDSVCLNANATFTNTSVPTPASVLWSFGDGTTSTQLNPVKAFSTPGVYNVKMVANFGACLDSSIHPVTVLPKPTADFNSPNPASCNTPHTVSFNNTSMNAISYAWNLSDNTTSTTFEPTHTYNNFGNYTIKLTVTNAFGCTDSMVKTNYIRIQQPIISFLNLPDSGCAPFTKIFLNSVTSAEPATSYLWDFGDGTTSTEVTPTHTYPNPGIFTVSLIISTAGGCADTMVLPNAIKVNIIPTAAFDATPKNTCAKIPVVFSDLSTGGVTGWLWDFGDGTTSNAQNPQHEYIDTGYFDVQLIVWSNGCPDTLKIDSFIHILPPIAKYNMAFDCSRPYERVFTDMSIGADQWLWDFGDGTTSTAQNPVHVYAAPGIYDVSLTVVNLITGCDYLTSKQIQIVDIQPQFFASDTVVCRGAPVTFTTGLSMAEVSNFAWNFGDGGTLSVATNTANHTYSVSGTYTVRLITTDVLGCKDTLVKNQYITVYGPTARFRSSVPGSCLNSLITFIDSSSSDGTHPISNWEWTYGDGIIENLSSGPFEHMYNTPGAYIVKLKVTDSYGCTDLLSLPTALIVSRPIAQFTSVDTLSCPNRTIRFTNQSTGPNLTYLWSFGDGTTATISTPTHNYPGDGIYTVKLSIIDQYGCTDSLEKPAFVKIVTPVASFTMSDTIANCPPVLLQITNNSNADVIRLWDFGDGTTSTTSNPSHFYSYPGNYMVKLSITGPGGCTDFSQHLLQVKGPTGTFNYDPLVGCVPVNINFTANTQNTDHFIWDFNDGATLNTRDSIVSYSYTYPGVYVPKMILVDAVGCQVPIVGLDTIVVNGVTANFGLSKHVLCDSGYVTFTDSSYSNDVIAGYLWNFGDGVTSTLQNPIHYYSATGNYIPKLVVTTQSGCIDSLQIPAPLKIVRSPKVSILSSANDCAPLRAAFSSQLAIPDTSQITWNWNFGNGITSTSEFPPMQTFTTAGVYNVQLRVTNTSGCFDTTSRNIEAYMVPITNAGLDTMVCKGTGITLKATGAINYQWSPAAGLSCTTCANPITNPAQPSTYIVKGTTIHGCFSYDTIKVGMHYPFSMKFSKPDTLCKGENKRLAAEGAHSYAWTPNKWLDNATSANPFSRPDSTITYQVIGSDAHGCFKDTGFVRLKVYPIPTVDAGNDRTINVGQTIDLIPTISSDVTEVIWSPTGSNFRNIYPGISVKPSENTEYTVEVSNPGGCAARDKVAIFVICNGANVFIPNTFSPNNDGANDVFYPRGTGLFRIKTLRIFNRWGELIFTRSGFGPNDPSTGWDGTYKGVKLTSDVFVYTAEVMCDNNSVLTLKGNVALIQ